jgi:hypothetical protein
LRPRVRPVQIDGMPAAMLAFASVELAE